MDGYNYDPITGDPVVKSQTDPLPTQPKRVFKGPEKGMAWLVYDYILKASWLDTRNPASEGRAMRRILFLVAPLLLALLLTGCFPDFYSAFPEGYVSADEFFDPHPTQDSTDYCKYYYADKTPFENHSSFRVIAEADVNDVRGYFSDFARWMEACDRLEEYDFDPGRITPGDYVRIVTKEGTPIGDSVYGKYDNYKVYFFDTETCILYYIHSNV